MGRSVSYLSNSVEEVFVDVSEMDESYDWDDFLSNIKYALKKRFPSLTECRNEWDGRETAIILDNYHCQIGVSEYCGVASISIRVNSEDADYRTRTDIALSENWISQVWNNMLKVMQDNTGYDFLVKQGSFSNGEAIYNKVGKKEGFCHNGGGKTWEFAT